MLRHLFLMFRFQLGCICCGKLFFGCQLFFRGKADRFFLCRLIFQQLFPCSCLFFIFRHLQTERSLLCMQ